MMTRRDRIELLRLPSVIAMSMRIRTWVRPYRFSEVLMKLVDGIDVREDDIGVCLRYVRAHAHDESINTQSTYVTL